MDVVSSTHNSKFPKRNPSKIFSDKENDDTTLISKSQKGEGVAGSDLIELSERTIQTLENLEIAVQNLIEKHPKYGLMFFSKEQSSHVQELESLASLLKEPNYQQLIDQDPKFLLFYEKIIGLGEIYQANLHRYQNDLRSSKPLTYSKPYGLEN
jgi:hypothetical protein